jgi:hypothetical protein
MAEGRDDRSLGELFSELAGEIGVLIRQELRQAGTEIGQRATGIGKDVGVLAAGAVILHVGLLALVAAAIIGLADLGLSWWLAALIVALVLFAGGFLLVQRARSALQRAEIMPRHTIDNLREDQEWVKDQIG